MRIKRPWCCCRRWRQEETHRSAHSEPFTLHGVDGSALLPLAHVSAVDNRNDERGEGMRRSRTDWQRLAAQHADDEDADLDELFSRVLRVLEICQERDDMSTAGSDVCVDLEEPDSPPHESPLPRHDLEELLRKLRLRELPAAETCMRLCRLVRAHLRTEYSTLVRLPAPAPKGRLIIVGDLHGHLNDLLHILDTYGEPCDSNQYLFNGDFVDRGVWGPEVLMMLFCLVLLHPSSVHLNRGNHESQMCNDRYGFKEQLMHSFPGHHYELYKGIHETFSQLPLCHVVGDKVFVVHGGLPLESLTLAEIEAIPRGPVPVTSETKEQRAFRCFLWSDPAALAGPSNRGAGCHFAEQQSRNFLQMNGLDCIVRSHECIPNGFRSTHGGLVKTVFSASNYTHENGNQGCVAIIGPSLDVKTGVVWSEPYVSHHDSSWNEDATADQESASALLRRVDSALNMKRSAKERALGELRRKIFLCRPVLLENFEEMDEGKDGKVTPAVWAEVMARCLETPYGFPWLELGPHLYTSEAGLVPYVPFLLRYDNPFSRWLADRWCNTLLRHMAVNLNGKAGDEFDRLDTSGSGVLAYSQLRQLARQRLPVTRGEALMQDINVFALFRMMDQARDGFVKRHEFVDTVNAAGAPVLQCPSHHTFNATEPGVCFLRNSVRVCDSCKSEMAKHDTSRCCQLCDFDLCQRCASQYIGPDVSKLAKQWNTAEKTIRILCQSRCDARAVFSLADSNRDGYLDQQEFVLIVQDLLQGDRKAAERLWELVCLYGESGGHQEGRLWIDEFKQCLEVMDMNDYDNPQMPRVTFKRRAYT